MIVAISDGDDHYILWAGIIIHRPALDADDFKGLLSRGIRKVPGGGGGTTAAGTKGILHLNHRMRKRKEKGRKYRTVSLDDSPPPKVTEGHGSPPSEH